MIRKFQLMVVLAALTALSFVDEGQQASGGGAVATAQETPETDVQGEQNDEGDSIDADSAENASEGDSEQAEADPPDGSEAFEQS